MSSGRDEMMAKWSEDAKKRQEEKYLERWERGDPLKILLRREAPIGWYLLFKEANNK